ncbi:HTTM domain-containing protein [Flavobacterium oreochromis]
MLFSLNIEKNIILLVISIFFFLHIFLFLSYFRLYSDTSDKLQFFTLIGLIIGFSYSNYLGILFIALNVLVIYFFTGINKIKSKPWLNGSAIFMVMNIETYGNKKIAKFLYKKKYFQKILSWLIILFQLSFPLCLINKNFCIIYLTLGFIFHLSNMIIMKLHNFFWLFIATYPCIYYLSLRL